MSLLFFSNPLPPLASSSSSFSCSTSTLFPIVASVSRFNVKPTDLHTKPVDEIRFGSPMLGKKMGRKTAVKATSEVDGTGPADEGEAGEESKEKLVSVDKLPLESKLQERMEQKMRMKMAKKIRLRRKRLVRKRRLRKKGRWPPSKMKKLKNV
ncbi:hypothetical protein K2173_015021 [Erythroxylum novogranatense]|uniref:50S ribosomal protein 5, chloroplastic n=1 Tax=Erythroxylum novogranatense TaxID=1862640 RepID=A0AAV8TTT6_9ROSI|nr:hypothetical protein K2173_015021 [Erythroxylum novogranatense]